MNRSTALRLAGASVLVAAIAASLIFLPAKQCLAQFLEWVERVGPWGPVFVIGLYIVACLLFIPGSLITLGTGFLFGAVWGTVTVSIGSTLAATAAFLVGRTLARGWIEEKVADNLKFQAMDRAVGSQGFKIVLLTRLSPLFPFNLLNFAFGLTRVSLPRYVLASWIGMLPGTVMYVYLGSAAKSLADLAAGKIEGGWQRQVLFGVGLVVAAVVTLLVTRIARRALKEAGEVANSQETSRASTANA